MKTESARESFLQLSRADPSVIKPSVADALRLAGLASAILSL